MVDFSDRYAVICASTEEYEILIRVFEDRFEEFKKHAEDDPTPSYIVNYHGAGNPILVSLYCCQRQGNIDASLLAIEVALKATNKLICFVGIAASADDSKLKQGDVFFPYHVRFREFRRVTDNTQKKYADLASQANPEVFMKNSVLGAVSDTISIPDSSVNVIARFLASLNLDSTRLYANPDGGGRPSFRIVNESDLEIGNSGIVINSAEYLDKLTNQSAKLFAVDMESYGFFKSVNALRKKGSSKSIPIMIRGVSDYATNKEEADKEHHWHDQARENVSTIVAALLRQYCEWEFGK